jgi:N-acyl-D-amino-acid deacylase
MNLDPPKQPRGSPLRARGDIHIRGGVIYDGSGGEPFRGDVVVDADRIAYVGPPADLEAGRTIDAGGLGVAPGFINMLSQSQESLLVDGRAMSELLQGVTLQVTGEGDSMGPLTGAMAARNESRQGNIRYPISWRSLGGYLDFVERRGISVNIASMVGAATIRDFVLGESNVEPNRQQLTKMRALVRQAMAEGALGVSSALIYAPGAYATTSELIELASEAARCGGIYITHMRSEGDDLIGALDETIEIARASGAPTEIYHLKVAGRGNWPKLTEAISRIEEARARGLRITADMYPYTAGATGFDASMPHWVLDGGLEVWIARLKDPETRTRLLHEMREPPAGFESALVASGPDGARLMAFRSDALKSLTGKTLAEVARARGVSPEETVLDLVIEDGTRVGVAYTVMSEDNVRRQVGLPWMSFCSDERATAPEGVFLEFAQHPRAYGSFAKVLGHYVRDEGAASLPDAIRRMTSLPADNLSLDGRGRLEAGAYADIVVFDSATIQDHATFDDAQRFATGVKYVLVNGAITVDEGSVTEARSGRAVRGRYWAEGGFPRESGSDWNWRW